MTIVDDLLTAISQRDFVIGIAGLGYVGIPLALAATRAGFRVVGFDIDARRVTALNAGKTGMAHLLDSDLRKALDSGLFIATSNMKRLSEPDAVIITVQTPLTGAREPDLSFVLKCAQGLGARLRRHQLVILESTTWPGTTREVVQPALEASGMKAGTDFYLAYSPEREDPGNTAFNPKTTPKVVGADDAHSLALARRLYEGFIDRVVPVSSTRTAEAVKLAENVFRAVNIALANEFKLVFDSMSIDVWEVIEAAKTKPYGYMPFYPGPGLGGHCIPVDPVYLTWKARQFDAPTPLISMADDINRSMPQYVVKRLACVLEKSSGKTIYGSRILVVGISYKKNVCDIRCSPSLELLDILEQRGARVSFHDPLVPEIPGLADHPHLAGRRSIDLDADVLKAFDAIIIGTDHDSVEWSRIGAHGAVIMDTRNRLSTHEAPGERYFKA